MDEPPWMLVGRLAGVTHVIGPFDVADDARDWANSMGIPQIEWDVVTLTSPRGDSVPG